MKKMFFIANLVLGLFFQAQGQKCLCDSVVYHIEQDWTPTASKDSLAKRVVLASKNKKEILCVVYQDGTAFSVEIPFSGKWRIHNMTDFSVTLESRQQRIVIFNLIYQRFSNPETYYGLRFYNSDPHNPDNPDNAEH